MTTIDRAERCAHSWKGVALITSYIFRFVNPSRQSRRNKIRGSCFKDPI
ncbi:hypothetical protein [Corynebacterium variabile]|nr:hypothetical protein [Corynebacterium variabile]